MTNGWGIKVQIKAGFCVHATQRTSVESSQGDFFVFWVCPNFRERKEEMERIKVDPAGNLLKVKKRGRNELQDECRI